jgi:hypothetical protein
VTEGQFRAGVLEVLISLKGAVEALTAALTPAPEPPPEPEPELGACQHPEDARVVFGGMGAEDEWQCRLCGHRQMKDLT